jgi:hypothetical protein
MRGPLGSLVHASPSPLSPVHGNPTESDPAMIPTQVSPILQKQAQDLSATLSPMPSNPKGSSEKKGSGLHLRTPKAGANPCSSKTPDFGYAGTWRLLISPLAEVRTDKSYLFYSLRVTLTELTTAARTCAGHSRKVMVAMDLGKMVHAHWNLCTFWVFYMISFTPPNHPSKCYYYPHSTSEKTRTQGRMEGACPKSPAS